MVIIHMNDLLSVIVFKRFCWFIQSGENSHLWSIRDLCRDERNKVVCLGCL